MQLFITKNLNIYKGQALPKQLKQMRKRIYSNTDLTYTQLQTGKRCFQQSETTHSQNKI